MRLKTKIRQIRPGSLDCTNNVHTRDDLCHDAAVAHALLQAMKEMDFDAFCTPVQELSRRANELMKEWGYSE